MKDLLKEAISQYEATSNLNKITKNLKEEVKDFFVSTVMKYTKIMRGFDIKEIWVHKSKYILSLKNKDDCKYFIMRFYIDSMSYTFNVYSNLSFACNSYNTEVFRFILDNKELITSLFDKGIREVLIKQYQKRLKDTKRTLLV